MTPEIRPLAFAALLVALLGILLTPTAALAADSEYGSARKLGRGLAGVTLGVLEIPGNIVKVREERGNAVGFTVGVAQGLGKFVIREVVGTFEILTSWFPMPPGYRPVMTPEYPWSYFQDSGR